VDQRSFARFAQELGINWELMRVSRCLSTAALLIYMYAMGEATLRPEHPMTKPKHPSNLIKTGKHWSPEDDRLVSRVFALIAPVDGPSINAAIERVLGRKSGDHTLVGTSPWRKLQRHVRTARNMAERNGVDIPYNALTPEDFAPPQHLMEQIAAFAKKLRARYLKSGSDAATGPLPKT
jgi:hypothetical protein